MNHQWKPEIYTKCESEFASAIAETLHAVLRKQASLPPAQREELLSQLTFAVFAHLSGSSFGGEVEGQQVYPVLAFSVGEDSDAVYFGNRSALHEVVPSVLAALGS